MTHTTSLALPGGFAPEKYLEDPLRVLIIFIRGEVTQQEVAEFANQAANEGAAPQREDHFQDQSAGVESYGIVLEDHLQPQCGCLLPIPIARLFLAQGPQGSQAVDHYGFYMEKHILNEYLKEVGAVLKLEV